MKIIFVSVLVKRKFIIFVLVSISVHENITDCNIYSLFAFDHFSQFLLRLSKPATDETMDESIINPLVFSILQFFDDQQRSPNLSPAAIESLEGQLEL